MQAELQPASGNVTRLGIQVQAVVAQEVAVLGCDNLVSAELEMTSE
jgi:hypothetical protein